MNCRIRTHLSGSRSEEQSRYRYNLFMDLQRWMHWRETCPKSILVSLLNTNLAKQDLTQRRNFSTTNTLSLAHFFLLLSLLSFQFSISTFRTSAFVQQDFELQPRRYPQHYHSLTLSPIRSQSHSKQDNVNMPTWTHENDAKVRRRCS